MKFPEPEAPVAEAVAEVEPVAEPESQLQPEATVAGTVGEVTPVGVEEAPVVEQPKEPKTAPAKGKAGEEPEDDEHAKDGVSLDELFSMKPEIFQTPGAEDDDSADKKKGKKGKKKSVELVLDEERGEVVGRKKHKRGDDELGEDW
jgi:N utilization substance protein A